MYLCSRKRKEKKMNCVENLEGEIWRYIMSEELGFYPYMISNKGRIKSLKNNKTRKEKLLNQGTTKLGYKTVVLCRKGEKPRSFYVHRLVASMFIKNPDNLPQINHIDENKTNNTIENLEFCSVQHNITWGTRTERQKETRKSSDAWKEHITKLRAKKMKIVYQYTTDNILIEVYTSIKSAATATGFSKSMISEYCRNKRKQKTYKGFIWSYTPIESSTKTEKKLN